jgi:hypothetical protein
VHEFKTAGINSGVQIKIIFSFFSQIFVKHKIIGPLGLLRFELKCLNLPLLVPAVVF